MGEKKRLMWSGCGKQETQDEAGEIVKGKFMQHLLGHMKDGFYFKCKGF